MTTSSRRPPARSGATRTPRRAPAPAASPPRRSLFGFDSWRRRRRRAAQQRGDTGSRRPALLRWVTLPTLAVTLVVVGVLSLAVVPTRTYLERRGEIVEAERQLAQLTAANETDAARIAALDTDAELERVARRDFRLALPGEEVYRVLPPVLDPSSVPSGWPSTIWRVPPLAARQEVCRRRRRRLTT